jgi:hypothetical protein
MYPCTQQLFGQFWFFHQCVAVDLSILFFSHRCIICRPLRAAPTSALSTAALIATPYGEPASMATGSLSAVPRVTHSYALSGEQSTIPTSALTSCPSSTQARSRRSTSPTFISFSSPPDLPNADRYAAPCVQLSLWRTHFCSE